MRILANDGLAAEGLELLAREGFEADARKRSPEELSKEIASFDALLVRSATRADRALIEAGAGGTGRLKIIGRAGIGVDNIDLDAARDHGVIVKNAPSGNANAAAELALALLFAAMRHIARADATLKSGVWRKKPFMGEEIAGKTLGIIGCGRIGMALAAKARGLGMRILGFDPRRQLDAPLDYVDFLDELLAESDCVSIHAGGSREIIGARELSLMKPGAVLVNASRGGNVDEAALYEALSQGRLACAAIDCHAKEPGAEGAPFTSRLKALDNVILTPHIGASTRSASVRTGIEIAQAVVNYLKLGDFRLAVNAGETVEEEGRAIYSVFLTHEDAPGMFGRLGAAFGEMGVNIRENNSRKLKDCVQTVYIIHQPPTPEMLERLMAVPGVRRAAG